MRQFAKEKIRSWLRVLLHTKDSPERTSFAFALGVFIAFLPPVPWFHTVFALLLAFIFRLNRLAVLVGTYLNTPLTVAPVLILEVTIGVALIGGGEVPELTMKQFRTAQGWKDAYEALTPFLAPLLVGSVIVGLLAAGCAYLICVRGLLVYRRRLAAAAVGAAAAATAVVAHAVEAAAEATAKVAARAKVGAEQEATEALAHHKQLAETPAGSEERPGQGHLAPAVPPSSVPRDPSKTSS